MLLRPDLGSGFPTGPLVAASLLSGVDDDLKDPSFQRVAGESFMIISAAEIFDKTFFIVMIMTATHAKSAVFMASSVALLAHVGICATAGAIVGQYLSKRVTLGIIVILYTVYGAVFLLAWWQSDKTKPAEEDGMEEAQGALRAERTEDGMEGESLQPQPLRPPTSGWSQDRVGERLQEPKEEEVTWTGWWLSFMITFSAVFLGEFGDRTQIAMIGQTANYPVWPVCLGCGLAFIIQVGLSMIAGEALVRLGISHATMLLFGAISFFGFAIWALVFQD